MNSICVLMEFMEIPKSLFHNYNKWNAEYQNFVDLVKIAHIRKNIVETFISISSFSVLLTWSFASYLTSIFLDYSYFFWNADNGRWINSVTLVQFNMNLVMVLWWNFLPSKACLSCHVFTASSSFKETLFFFLLSITHWPLLQIYFFFLKWPYTSKKPSYRLLSGCWESVYFPQKNYTEWLLTCILSD